MQSFAGRYLPTVIEKSFGGFICILQMVPKVNQYYFSILPRVGDTIISAIGKSTSDGTQTNRQYTFNPGSFISTQLYWAFLSTYRAFLQCLKRYTTKYFPLLVRAQKLLLFMQDTICTRIAMSLSGPAQCKWAQRVN